MTIRRLERQRAATNLTVRQLTITELQAEINRRVRALAKQRDEIRARLEELDREIAAIQSGTEVGRANGESKKRMSADDYADAVEAILEAGQVYTISTICERLVASGHNAKKSTMSQGMAAWLVEEKVLEDKGKRGRANQYALASAGEAG